MPFITYQNHRIHYFIEGEGEKVIFLHGWPTNAHLWKAQIEYLKTYCTTIAIDWLGFGNSDKPLDFPYSFTQMKEILKVALSNVMEKEEKISIVAHDIGGPPAILWAGENEARVKRLVLLNTILFPFKTRLDAFSEILLDTPWLKDLFVSPRGLKIVMKTNTKSSGPALNQEIESILLPLKKESPALKRIIFTGPMRQGHKHEIPLLKDIFKDLQIPKYLIIADKDPLCYAHIKQLSDLQPEVPVFPLKGCGHFIPIDQPQALNSALTEIFELPS